MTEKKTEKEIILGEIAERFVGSISYNAISSIATQKEKFEELCKLIKTATTIVMAGEGRSGLVAEASGQRIGHVLRALHKMIEQELIERSVATIEAEEINRSEISKIFRSFCKIIEEDGGVYSVNNTNVPPIYENCLVIMPSGSGETKGQIEIARKVKEIKARLVVLTSFPESTIGKMADLVIFVQGRSIEESESLLPMGTKFEITVLIILEILIAYMIEKEGIPSDILEKMHRNL